MRTAGEGTSFLPRPGWNWCHFQGADASFRTPIHGAKRSIIVSPQTHEQFPLQGRITEVTLLLAGCILTVTQASEFTKLSDAQKRSRLQSSCRDCPHKHADCREIEGRYNAVVPENSPVSQRASTFGT